MKNYILSNIIITTVTHQTDQILSHNYQSQKSTQNEVMPGAVNLVHAPLQGAATWQIYYHNLRATGGVSGSGSATGELGHYGSHPRPQVADRGTPSRMDKRVAPDKGAADKQCLRRRKTLIPNRGRWSSLSLFRQIHLGEGKL